MKNPIASPYHARMLRVLDHIDAHLDEDLDAALLAAVAAFSSHHFQRQFSALLGISVHRYVRLMRLRRACYRLAFRTDEAVTSIAFDSGYDSHEAFSRAFRQAVGQTPTEFRGSPEWASWHAAAMPLHSARTLLMTPDFTDADVTLIDFEATPVALLEHRGDSALIGDTVRRFIAWRRANGLPPAKSATFNILHADPDECPAEDFRMDLCAATSREVEPNGDGIVPGLIPGGRCAVLRFSGPSERLRTAAVFLYGDWLPRSGETLRDFPLFLRRVTFYPDVPEQEAVSLLHLPLQ